MKCWVIADCCTSEDSTSTRSGLRSRFCASATMGSGKVAENNRLCRSPAVRALISRMAGSKPMSSMRSASSSTSVLTPPRCSTFLRISSCTRPGVPTTICGSCACSEANCGANAVPPHRVESFRLGMPSASLRSSRLTCSANSRVGHSTNAWARIRLGSMRASKASPNATVLPLPVGAWAIRSRPAKANGKAAAWIGVGWV